jgi:hypothetical protein
MLRLSTLTSASARPTYRTMYLYKNQSIQDITINVRIASCEVYVLNQNQKSAIYQNSARWELQSSIRTDVKGLTAASCKLPWEQA